MRVSSITRRKLLLLSKERSNDFKHHLSNLTTTLELIDEVQTNVKTVTTLFLFYSSQW